jgi:hypothetical protein
MEQSLANWSLVDECKKTILFFEGTNLSAYLSKNNGILV